jgi:hypothetical protein
VGSGALGEAERRRVLEALMRVPGELLADVCLEGFRPATLRDYDETLRVRHSRPHDA